MQRFTSAIAIDKVQRKFCKWMLNVKQSTERHVRIIKYWIELNSNESVYIIIRTVYRSMVEDLSKGQ